YINTVRSTFQRDINLAEPVQDAIGRYVFTSARPYAPDYFVMQMTESSARSLYRGFTYTFKVRRPRFTLDAFYTLSWKYSHDDVEQDYSAISYDNAYDRSTEYNYSLTDQRHQFIAYGIYNLPFSFDVSSTARFTSARPFEVMTMWDYNRDDMQNDRPIVNGEPLPRNAFRSRPFYDVSLRFQKHFALPNEKGRFTVSVEFFNLFGFDNVQIGHPNMVYGDGTAMQGGAVVSGPIGPDRWYDPMSRKTYAGGTLVQVAPPANFNQLRKASGEYYKTNIPGDPFQMQLGLRFQF
ncbi:MAG: hypothetical protein HY647_10240, partial [Acidobacteria bacterium]|nr:hypothetical protein [Acidobacteriota bacterium]